MKNGQLFAIAGWLMLAVIRSSGAIAPVTHVPNIMDGLAPRTSGPRLVSDWDTSEQASPNPDAQREVNAFLRRFEGRSLTTGGYSTNLQIAHVYTGPPVRVRIKLIAAADIPLPTPSEVPNQYYGKVTFVGVQASVKTPYGQSAVDCVTHSDDTETIQIISLTCGQNCVLDLDLGIFRGCPGIVKAFVLNGEVLRDRGDSQCGVGCNDGSPPMLVALQNLSGPSVSFNFGSSGALTTEQPQSGLFVMSQSTPSTNLFNPEALTYVPSSSNIEVIMRTNLAPYVRQVKGVEGLADVIIVSTNGYEVRYYHPTNVLSKDGSGLWQVANSPLKTVCFLNAVPGATNGYDLHVIASESGSSVTNH